ncbi:MAG: 4Fe-4S binding protein [Acidobacteriia bacterium]|nr:4Fe-4S binding protein [Terriglobia bacterium]
MEGSNQLPIAMHCRHCLNAPCVDACLTGALTREPKSNLVVVQEDRCIACWTCTMFCPYGVIYPWPDRKIALKCDRCAFMDNPVCVEVCPCKALELVDVAPLSGSRVTSLKGGAPRNAQESVARRR